MMKRECSKNDMKYISALFHVLLDLKENMYSVLPKSVCVCVHVFVMVFEQSHLWFPEDYETAAVCE